MIMPGPQQLTASQQHPHPHLGHHVTDTSLQGAQTQPYQPVQSQPFQGSQTFQTPTSPAPSLNTLNSSTENNNFDDELDSLFDNELFDR